MDVDVGRALLQADVVAAYRVEGVLVDADVRGAADADALGIAIEQVVPDLQAIHGRGHFHRHAVVAQAAVLQGADKGRHTTAVAFDQVGCVQRRATDDARAGHARDVVADVLALELCAHRHHTRAVVDDVVDARACDKAQAIDRAGHGGANAHGVVGDAVVGQGGRGVIAHARGGAVEGVAVDQACEGGGNVQACGDGQHVVVADATAGGHGQVNAHLRGLDAVVAHGELGGGFTARTGQHRHALGGHEDVVVDQGRGHGAPHGHVTCDVVGHDLGQVAANQGDTAHRRLGQGEAIGALHRYRIARVQALNDDVVGPRLNGDAAVELSARRAIDQHASVIGAHRHVARGRAHDDDGIARAQVVVVQDGLHRGVAVGREGARNGGTHATHIDLGLAVESVLPGHAGAALAVGGHHQLRGLPAGVAQATWLRFTWQLFHEVAADQAHGVQVGGAIFQRLTHPDQAQRIATSRQLWRSGQLGRAKGVAQADRTVGRAIEADHGQGGALVRMGLPGGIQQAIEVGHRGLRTVADAPCQAGVCQGAQAGARGRARQAHPRGACIFLEVDRRLARGVRLAPSHGHAVAIGGHRQLAGVDESRAADDAGAAGAARAHLNPGTTEEGAGVDLLRTGCAVQPDHHRALARGHDLGRISQARARDARDAQGRTQGFPGTGDSVISRHADVAQAAMVGRPGHDGRTCGVNAQARMAGCCQALRHASAQGVATGAAAQGHPHAADQASHQNLRVAASGVRPGHVLAAIRPHGHGGVDGQATSARQATVDGGAGQIGPTATLHRAIGQGG